jgi:hypothetical protein
MKMEVDYKDQYYKLQSENQELKSIHNEMEEHNRKLQSNIRKLERDYTKIAGGAPVPTGPRDKEDEQLVSKLYAENSKLKASNTSIKEKYKTLAEQFDKKKRECVMLQKKIKAGTGSSIPPLPAAGRGTSVLQEIDIKSGPSNRAGLRSSSGAAVHTTGGTAVSSSVDALPDAENSKYMQVARNLKVK